MLEPQNEKEALRQTIWLGQAMERLNQNPDFVQIFKKVFVKDRQELCIRKLISNDVQIKQEGINELEVIAHMQEYFDMLLEDAKKASQSLLEIDQ